MTLQLKLSRKVWKWARWHFESFAVTQVKKRLSAKGATEDVRLRWWKLPEKEYNKLTERVFSDPCISFFVWIPEYLPYNYNFYKIPGILMTVPCFPSVFHHVYNHAVLIRMILLCLWSVFLCLHKSVMLLTGKKISHKLDKNIMEILCSFSDNMSSGWSFLVVWAVWKW